MSNPTSNYSFQMPTSTDLVTDLPADFEVFGQAVDTQIKNLNPETTQGDISYRAATANAKTRLGIGTAGQVLTVNSGATAPEWATAAGMTLISTTTFSSTSVTVSSIPSTFKHLYIFYSELYGNTDNEWLVVRPNNLSTSIYTYHNFSAFNSSLSIDFSSSGTYVPVGHMTSSSTGRNKASGVIWIPNYTSTDAIKFVTSSSRVVTSTGQRTGLYQGTLDLNSAITSLVFTAAATTTFTNGKIYLYGVN